MNSHAHKYTQREREIYIYIYIYTYIRIHIYTSILAVICLVLPSWIELNTPVLGELTRKNEKRIWNHIQYVNFYYLMTDANCLLERS